MPHERNAQQKISLNLWQRGNFFLTDLDYRRSENDHSADGPADIGYNIIA
jgi:hypothetical protein